MRDDELLDFLRRLGRSLSTGDAAGVADCWAVPALVLMDGGAMPVTDRAQVERYIAGAIEAYRSRKVEATEPEVLRIDRLSERLATVDVRWPYLDAAQNRQGDEVSGYLVWVDDQGRPGIRVAYTRGR
jgi:hypothetical protein